MAKSYLPIDTTKRFGAKLQEDAALLGDAVSKIRLMNDLLQNMQDGVDYTLVEQMFGLPAGKGADLVYLVAGAKTALDSPVLQQFTAWLGGV
jgi:hypothetical protein